MTPQLFHHLLLLIFSGPASESEPRVSHTCGFHPHLFIIRTPWLVSFEEDKDIKRWLITWQLQCCSISSLQTSHYKGEFHLILFWLPINASTHPPNPELHIHQQSLWIMQKYFPFPHLYTALTTMEHSFQDMNLTAIYLHSQRLGNLFKNWSVGLPLSTIFNSKFPGFQLRSGELWPIVFKLLPSQRADRYLVSEHCPAQQN